MSQGQEENWNGGQSSNYSDYSDDEEYSDDEYAPVVASAWGTQTITSDGRAEINVSAGGWDSLLDPNYKEKAGGLGSGQLHRKGGNFKPIDEQLIVNQRLGKPIPKELGGGKKKGRGGKKKSAGGPPRRRPPPSSKTPPSSATYRSSVREMAPGKSAWGNTQLSTTPFWQQSASSPVTGSGASKYASQPPPRASAPASHPAAPLQQQHQQRQQEPSYAPATASNNATWTPTAANGSAASKYATGSGTSKWATPAPSAPAPAPAAAQQQGLQQQQTTVYQMNDNSQQPPPIHTMTLDDPIVTLKIEMSAGIHATIPLYRGDDANAAVARFEREHKLNLDELRKSRMAEKLADILIAYGA